MKYPRLVPPSVCHTPITIHLTNGINEDGAPNEMQAIETSCNYSEKARQVLDAQRQLVLLEATALLDGDIAPGEDIEGWVTLAHGQARSIYRSERCRDPNGRVNYTKLELM